MSTNNDCFPWPSQEELEGLSVAFSPHLWLGKSDRFGPASAEEYLRNCSLWRGDSRLAAEGELKPEGLHPESTPPTTDQGCLSVDQNLHLRCNQQFHHGVPSERLQETPIYCHPRRANKLEGGEGSDILALVYTAFYPYNGPYNVGCYLVGGHEADWEHSTVHLEKRDGSWKIHSVWYGTHRERDGFLQKGSNVEMSGTHPVLCVAKNGHGMYPWSGTIFRLFGFANDVTSKGRLWKPTPVLLPDVQDVYEKGPSGLSWLLFPGRWGTTFGQGHGSKEERASPGWVKGPGGCPAGPAAQDWWYGEPCKSRTFMKRMFFPGSQ